MFEGDITLKRLRNKTVRRTISKVSAEDEGAIITAVKYIIQNNGSVFNCDGTPSVKKLSARVPRKILNAFSKKELEELVNKAMQ